MSAQNLLRIAQRISRFDPLLSYELERSVVALSARTAVVNPGAKKFEEHVDQMVALLKSARQDLKKALEDFNTAEEFAKFFKEGALDEEFEQLQKLLSRAAKLPPIPKAAAVAGPKDWVKKLFPGKKKLPERDPEEYGMSPSYKLDEGTMDEFVEGKREWADPSHYIEQESRENKEFFDGAKDLIKQVQDIRKKPEKGAVKKLLDQVDALIRKGGNVLKGIYKHLEEPAPKVDLEEDKPQKPAPGKKVFNLEGTVDHYVDMLKEHSGDAKKTMSLLKELFDAVGPALEGEKASFAARRRAVTSALIKYAHTRPEARPVLLPFIRVQTAAMTPSLRGPARSV